MSVRLQLDFANLGLEDYDRTCETLNFPDDWPEGLMGHASFEVDGRLRVVDIWQTREHFDRFVQERLQAAMGEALGDRAEAPEVTEIEVHTFYSRR